MSEAFDPNDLANMALMVKANVDAYIERRLGPLVARLEQMELRTPLAGDRGEKGEMGGTGPQGPMGEAGPMGEPGPLGAMGEPGPMGPAGPMGEQGPMGECGPMGEPGPMGPMGDKGADGAVGKDGAAGALGDKGEVGAKGDAGVQGPAGDKGERGEKGEPGIVGKDGAPGELGEKGLTGDKGDRGEKGEQGIAGKDGAPGAQGQKGLQGDPGEEGRDGKEGAPGRDALRIEIAEGIDAGRSHARGTYASHLGGLWRALRPTDAIVDGATAEQLQTAGWQVVMNGIADMSVNLGADLRTVNVGLMTTDGRAQLETLSLPTLVYRSLYVRGKEYAPGDLVTWDGSAWHCEATTTDEPGASPAWKLFARKGRDRTAA